MASKKKTTKQEKPSTALATTQPAEYQGLSMVMSADVALQRLTQLQDFIAKVMKPGEDFGKIPGAGDKPTLLQPGAQKLAEVYGLAHRFEEVECIKDWDKMFFQFEYRTILTSRRDGSYVGEGLGSCNSRESKYAYRWCFEDQLPLGLDKAKLEKKIITSRKPGRNFGKEFVQYKVPNQDLASVVNTLQKMAAKRSYIHAVISVTRSSGIFTQDVEDLPKEALGRHDDPPPEPTETKPADQVISHAKVIERFTELALLLEKTTTLDELKDAWAEVNRARKAKQLDTRTLEELEKQKDARRAAIDASIAAAGKAAAAADPLPETWGGDKPKTKEPGDAEPPADVKLEGDDERADDLGGRM